jgi:hypothetical protein
MAIAATCALVVVAALAVRKPPAPKTTAASAPPVIIASAPPPSPSVVASTEPSAQVAEREPGDPEACSIEDVGNGNYTERELGIASARLFVPDPLPREYDLLLHFHGGEPVRRLVAPAKLGLVIATIDAGQGSQRYRGVVGPKLLDEISAATLAKLGAKPRHLVLSSWSAGYGAVHELLLQAPTAWRAIVLLDSLHASYDASGKADEKTLVPFFALAKRAEAEEQLLVLTHSSITPPGYASTSEVAAAMIAHVGGRRRYAGLEPRFGVELRTRFDRNALHIRGYTGTDKAAHCAHLRLLSAILEDDVLPFLRR